MSVVVAYKWAGDPQEASVGADGSVDFGRARPGISEYDAVAIQVGRDLADALGTALVGVCVGAASAGAPVATKAALARGLDRVLVVADDSLATLGTAGTAQVLSALVGQVGDAQLVLAGDCSTDVGARMVPAVLGGTLGWATVTDAASVRADGADVVVERTLAEGAQTLRLALPAVVAVASDAAKPHAPGMKDVLGAGKKPADVITAAPVMPVGDGETLAAARAAAPARKGMVITGDAATAAGELVGALRAAGLLDEAGTGR